MDLQSSPDGFKAMNVTAIQRCAGERTQHTYLDVIAEQVQVVQLQAGDLYSTTLKLLEMIATQDDGWTLVVDGDVRLYPGCVDRIQGVLESLDDRYYQARFLLDDRFFRRPIFGLHAHRNKFAISALNWMLRNGKNGIRSESKNIKRFIRSQNLQTWSENLVVGNHDFEQYYRDIASKFIFKAAKYRDRLLSIVSRLLPNIQERDVRVALKALLCGISTGDLPGYCRLKLPDSLLQIIVPYEEKSDVCGDLPLCHEDLVRQDTPLLYP